MPGDETPIIDSARGEAECQPMCSRGSRPDSALPASSSGFRVPYTVPGRGASVGTAASWEVTSVLVAVARPVAKTPDVAVETDVVLEADVVREVDAALDADVAAGVESAAVVPVGRLIALTPAVAPDNGPVWVEAAGRPNAVPG